MRWNLGQGAGVYFLGALMASSMFCAAWSSPKPTAAPTVQNEVRVGPTGSSGVKQPAGPGGAAGVAPADLSGPPAKRILKRNPFVGPQTPGMATKGGKAYVKPAKKVRPGVGTEATPAAAAPPFTLAGIFSSGGFPTALFVTPRGAVEVRVGDTVQGYRVTTINLNTRLVVVEMRDTAFRVSLPKDKPYGTSGGPAPSEGGSAPGAGALPPPPAPIKGGGAKAPSAGQKGGK